MDFSVPPTRELAPALTLHLQKLGRKALANAVLKKDFHERPHRDGYRYTDGFGKDRSFIIFGELAGPEAGTQISAVGNFLTEHPNGGWITDSMKVRDRLALRIPKDGPALLEYLGRMQIATLNTVRLGDLARDEYDVRDIDVREWIGSDGVVQDDQPEDIIHVHTQIKFRNPRDIYQGTNTQRITRGSLSSVWKPDADAETWVGKPYAIDTLTDDNTNMFSLDEAKLIQQDIRDCEGDLIAPWKTPYFLPIGSLLLLQVRLYCQVTDYGHSIKKVYRIIADRIKVLSGVPIGPIYRYQRSLDDDALVSE
ncbi:hypothetical protein BDN72DRAFT_906259 [Pluteus cervinus]|uniref:Uncharacterized protein n=1 Tax=Pluteus cervinus TaxID=181527 RepID=A0ACD2ZZY9_9AGAR|nr:hypothetical protein BDN72DRAFT_906259 [Pluteus cervinus]